MLDVIYNAGDDALQNQFQVIIPAFPNVIDIGQVNLRVTNITIPDLAINTYEVHYKTDRITKPAGKNSTAKEFTFSFRTDKYWRVYNSFTLWHGLIFNQETGAMSNDAGIDGLGGISPIRVPFIVQSLDSNNVLTGFEKTFEGCWPSNVSGFEFNQDSGDPIIATITLQYIKMV